MTIFDNLMYKTEDEFLKKTIDAVERGYATMRRPVEVIKKNSFSPSAVGYKHNRCPRYHAMRFAGRYRFDDQPALQSLGVMNSGTAVHERIQGALEASGIVKELERETTYSDPPIRGFIDAIVEIDGEEFPVEIKSTRDEAFRWRVLRMNGPAYQMYQLLIYMYIENYDKGILLYENNNDKRLLAVPVYMTDENREAVEKVLDWMRKIWKAHEEDKLPARPWKQTSPNCADCPFFKECWDEPREDIKIKSLVVHPW